MPLEMRRNTVSHLKSLESSTRQGCGSNFIGPMLSINVLILLHREANEWFALLFAVTPIQRLELKLIVNFNDEF